MVHLATSSPLRTNSVLLKNLQRWRADIMRPYVWCVQRWRASTTESPLQIFRCAVGEDSIFPVVFPAGKTTSAQSADNAVSNILQWNSAVSCRNMVYFATSSPHLANSVLLKNLLRWRADIIRPYVWCVQRWRASATESPLQIFRCTAGEDTIFPVVSPQGKQRRRNAPTMWVGN